MREFQGRSGALARLSPGAKALYAGYNALALAALGTSVALYWGSIGLTPDGAAKWYLGNADDPAATDIILEKSPRQLLEITHQHLWTMPVAMLVLGHLFLLSRGGSWKSWVVGAAPILLALHVAGPWVVHYGGPAWGVWMPLTAIPFVAVFAFMALWPLPDLWPAGRSEEP